MTVLALFAAAVPAQSGEVAGVLSGRPEEMEER